MAADAGMRGPAHQTFILLRQPRPVVVEEARQQQARCNCRNEEPRRYAASAARDARLRKAGPARRGPQYRKMNPISSGHFSDAARQNDAPPSATTAQIAISPLATTTGGGRTEPSSLIELVSYWRSGSTRAWRVAACRIGRSRISPRLLSVSPASFRCRSQFVVPRWFLVFD